jgi:hypothetical protein
VCNTVGITDRIAVIVSFHFVSFRSSIQHLIIQRPNACNISSFRGRKHSAPRHSEAECIQHLITQKQKGSLSSFHQSQHSSVLNATTREDRLRLMECLASVIPDVGTVSLGSLRHGGFASVWFKRRKPVNIQRADSISASHVTVYWRFTTPQKKLDDAEKSKGVPG